MNRREEMLEYMDELSLIILADKYGITESYLSRLFKKVKGENISKYIENVRLRHAEALLGAGGKIVDISEQVGYVSVQVFRRVWKRHYGESPLDSLEKMRSDYILEDQYDEL